MNTIPSQSVDPLTAAMELFWERGYVATSLSDLLLRMRVSRKHIYSTYGNKEGLFRAALEAYVRDVAKPRMACLLERPAGLASIEEYLRTSEFHPGFRGSLLCNSVAESENLSAESLAIIHAHFADLKGALIQNLDLARERGELGVPYPTSAMAHQVMNTFMGMSLMGKLMGDASASTQMVDIMLSCMRGPGQRSPSAAAS